MAGAGDSPGIASTFILAGSKSPTRQSQRYGDGA
jgi:hypothetical protein